MPREPRRPSALRLWLRRRRPMLRPALRVLAGVSLLAVALAGLSAFDPAGRLSGLAERLSASLGERFGGMRVSDVRIEGARHAPAAGLAAAIGARPGDPILGFEPAEARARLEALAWIERAEVERHLSGAVVVRVREREPFAIWQHAGRFAVVDREGRTVATERLDAFGPLPLVVGAGAWPAAAALHDLLREEPDLLLRTQAMVRVGERRWNLRLHSGTDVLLPEGQEAAAVRRLGELHREAALLDRPLLALDLRLPDRLVMRPPPAPEPPVPRAAARPGGRG